MTFFRIICEYASRRLSGSPLRRSSPRARRRERSSMIESSVNRSKFRSKFFKSFNELRIPQSQFFMREFFRAGHHFICHFDRRKMHVVFQIFEEDKTVV